MNMTEVARLILGLRAAGWTEKEINDFVLYIASGEEQYKPKPGNEKEKQKMIDTSGRECYDGKQVNMKKR